MPNQNDNSTPSDADKFAQWLNGIPDVPDGDITINVPITLSRDTWVLLAAGAVRNGTTIAGAVTYLLDLHGLFEPGGSEGAIMRWWQDELHMGKEAFELKLKEKERARTAREAVPVAE